MSGIIVFLLVGGIGALAQILDGSLGMGFGVFGSSMMIATGFAPAVAVAAINIAKIFAGLSSGISHLTLGNVRRDWLWPLALSGVAGGVLGAYLLTSVPPERARPWVGLLLLVMGGLIIWRTLRWRVPCSPQAWDKRCRDCPSQKRDWQWLTHQAKHNGVLKLGAVGFLAALVNGLSGGYGPVATSGVMLLEKGEPRQAIGTVNLAEFFVATTVATTILLRKGLVGFPIGLVAALAIGGLLTAPLAAFLCRRLPGRALAFAVGIALIGFNYRLVASILP